MDLAGLYNQIKAAECRKIDRSDADAMQSFLEWKVGFIEDAEEMHLAGKPMFASVIRLWTRDEKVQERFIADVTDGKRRLQRLMKDVKHYPAVVDGVDTMSAPEVGT